MAQSNYHRADNGVFLPSPNSHHHAYDAHQHVEAPFLLYTFRHYLNNSSFGVQIMHNPLKSRATQIPFSA